jgi:hypothetical protein
VQAVHLSFNFWVFGFWFRILGNAHGYKNEYSCYGFQSAGFRVEDLRSRYGGFRVQNLALRVWGLESKV